MELANKPALVTSTCSSLESSTEQEEAPTTCGIDDEDFPVELETIDEECIGAKRQLNYASEVSYIVIDYALQGKISAAVMLNFIYKPERLEKYV